MDALCVHSSGWVQEELSRGTPPHPIDFVNGLACIHSTKTRNNQRLCQTTGKEQKIREEEKKEEERWARFEDDDDSALGYLPSLKACTKQKDVEWGWELHKDIVECGLLDDDRIGSALINMYAKCGFLTEAQDVFDEISLRTTISWTSLISGYANHGQDEAAVAAFERMKCDGFFPDRVSFLSVLKACGNMGAIEKSQEIHAQILKSGSLERDTVLATALVDVYAKCNWLERASEVFDMLNAPDIVAWNTLITGYACLEYGKKALHYFDQLLSTSLSPNAITFSAALKACATLGAIERGQKIHAEVVKEGLFLKNDTVVDNTLVYMYAKCGLVSKAQELFDELPIRNTVTWNALIAGYTQNGQSEKALHLFDQMQLEGLPPDAFTYSCILKACGLEGLVGKGLSLHMEIVNGGAFDSNLVVGNALVDMYMKCGLVVEAQDVFDNLCNKNVVAWSALIVGYANHGLCGQAIDCFEQMCLKGFHPNIVTFLGVLKACGSIGDTCMGQKVHLEIIKGEKMLDRDIALGTALVDMYAKCGLLVEAKDVFDDLPHQDIVAWNALLSGYTNYLHGEAALNCFEQMRSRGFSPDLATFASVMKACGCLGAFLKGQTVHCDVVRNGFLELDLLVGNALIDMYANCGMLKEAQNAFDSLPIRDLVSWNSVITGYAQSGKYENVFKLLHRLIVEFAKPDSVTFTLVLNTCCHNGLIDKMEAFIVMMDMEYGILPTKEHYVCLVDLFSRTGNIDLAIAITKAFPIPADVLVWNSLLGACKRQGNSKLGQWASEHVLQLGKQDPGMYVSLRNYHAAEGRDYDYSEFLNM